MKEYVSRFILLDNLQNFFWNHWFRSQWDGSVVKALALKPGDLHGEERTDTHRFSLLTSTGAPWHSCPPPPPRVQYVSKQEKMIWITDLIPALRRLSRSTLTGSSLGYTEKSKINNWNKKYPWRLQDSSVNCGSVNVRSCLLLELWWTLTLPLESSVYIFHTLHYLGWRCSFHCGQVTGSVLFMNHAIH